LITLLLRCALGAVVVLAIALLARTRNYYIAGLVPLFPTFALIAHYIVGSERSPADLRDTALFGMWAIVPYLFYLAAVYVLCTRLPLAWTLGLATLAWFVAAAALLTAWTTVFA
jgi:membrane protein GlpM